MISTRISLQQTLESIVNFTKIRQFQLDFDEIGEFDGKVLRGGIGYIPLLTQLKIPKKNLNWIGLVNKTYFLNIKDYILSVNQLESGYPNAIFEFYEQEMPEFELSFECIRNKYGIVDDPLSVVQYNCKNILKSLENK